MSSFSKILVVIDPMQDEQKALARAIELANKTGASVSALMTIYDFSYEMTTMLSQDERTLMQQAVIKNSKIWLDNLLEQQSHLISQLHGEVIWHNSPYQAIIEKVLTNNYDLVIKSTHQHPLIQSVIFTPTDWNLLRKCPSAVLLVKEHAWPNHSRVIAAINASSDQSYHQSLNHKIIKTARDIANCLHSKTILVNAFPSVPVNLGIEIPNFEPHTYLTSVKSLHIEGVHTYANQFDIPTEDCLIREGLPESVVPEIAEEIDAELVVLGTIGRTGLSAAIIGNTAEQVLDALNCDVLAVKPEGFICPISI
ncbi:universal stress protein UspE [Algibacillus agarilyticus]|uniref:universal stress protein UspE n=1 Tax=Algibacillus agarilyticus TaxID=2234133 RepID=UPI000DD00847|nr:universal stress protein UspE [Algibacillus agarilyticus]